jgi:AraC-like DNA-binding protein
MEHPVRHYLECALAVLLTFLRHVSEGVFVPQAIHLKQQEGASQQEYQAVYGCPVQLGSTTNAICFDAGLLGLPSPAAAPTLLAMHEQAAAQELADVAHQRLVWQVERELGGLLEGGELTLEAVANRLARSPRQLRQALSQAGTSFKQVVAEYREQLARRLLVRTREPLEQIVYLTGFSEPSAFTRAFKRWTGETPSAYRLRHQKDT